MFKLPDYVQTALELLHKSGFEAYIVGGCVRDLLLGKDPNDYDMTTSALPEETEAVFSLYPVIKTGIKHGTVTLMIDSHPLEITTYRVDGSYSDSRHPDCVRFTRSLKEDSTRRDFTINAMAYSPEEGVIDHHGGLADLEAGIIRSVGSAPLRFKEDALRIMRALRFSSQLGFEIEHETQNAAFELAALLKEVSSERLQSELLKLLCGKNAKSVILKYVNILSVFIPELAPMENFDQRNIHHIHDVLTHSAIAVENVPPEPRLRLAALLHDIGKPLTFTVDDKGVGHFYGHAGESLRLSEDILTRLRFSNAAKQHILTLVKWHDVPISPAQKSVKKALGKLGKELFFDLTALKRADNLAQSPLYHQRQEEIAALEETAREIISHDQCFSLKDLAINGKDLMALGIPQGKMIGEVLSALLEAVVDEKVENQKDALCLFVSSNLL
ncbi:MAG: HD domain-containing protein [Oscillospiraceae bacterium]|nr:HD domain-containing protein [Oscillospiraceae bacterium]